MEQFSAMMATLRARPGMYFGSKSFTALRFFLDGYCSALVDIGVFQRNFGIWRDASPELPRFHDWVAMKLEFGPSRADLGWQTAVLRSTNNDEEAAFDLFWTLFDEYCTLESVITSPDAAS